MNREEYRKYLKKNKKDKRLSTCPLCNKKALFYTTQIKDINKLVEVTSVEDGTTDISSAFTTAVKCDVCGGTVLQGEAVTKLLPPGIYLPLPLDLFQIALKYADEEEKPENE